MKKTLVLRLDTVEKFHDYVEWLCNQFALLPQQETLIAAYGEMRFPGLHPADSPEGVDKVTNTVADKMKVLQPARDCLVFTAQADGLRVASGNYNDQLSLAEKDSANYFFLNDESSDEQVDEVMFSLREVVEIEEEWVIAFQWVYSCYAGVFLFLEVCHDRTDADCSSGVFHKILHFRTETQFLCKRSATWYSCGCICFNSWLTAYQ